MAQGDVKWFRKALHNLGEKVFDLSSDTFKLAIIDNSTATWDTLAELINLSDPRWGAAGTQDLSADQVSTAGGYTGPITLTGVAQSQERVSELLRNLSHRSEWLSQPQLLEITAGNLALSQRDQRRVFNFSMRVTLKQGQPTAEPAAPGRV